MAEVVLVFPKLIDVKSAKAWFGPPLGILTLAGVLMERGVSVKIIDQRTDRLWQETLINELEKGHIFIGLSSMSGLQIKYALEIASFVKKRWKTPIVWGGMHPTLEPVSTARHELVDIAVTGEGEKTVIELLEYFKGKVKLREVKGIAFRFNNQVVVNEPNSAVDLNSLPFTPFYLVDLKQYKADRGHFGFTESVYIPIETSRGCSHRCKFCYVSMQALRWMAMDAQRVVEHITNVITEYKIHAICFYDNNFVVDPARVDGILKLLTKQGISIEWYTNMRAEYLLKFGLPILRKLEYSGCKSITIGLESGSDDKLRQLDKRMTVKEIIEVNRLIKKSKIIVLFGVIIGFPYETLETIKKTYRVIIKILLDNPRARVDIVRLIPMPRTSILLDCAKAGFSVPQTLEEWIKVTIPNLLNYREWLDNKVLHLMDDFDYFRFFIKLTRSKPNKIGRFFFKIYANFFILRFKYDYFSLWLEPKVFSAISIARERLKILFLRKRLMEPN